MPPREHKDKGRTLGDVFVYLLRIPFHVVLKRTSILVAVLIVSLLVLKLVGVRKLWVIEFTPASSFQFAREHGVLFSSDSRKRRQYVLVVPAQGWWPTAIRVTEGDSLEFEASGSVQISLVDLLKKAQLRYRLESTLVARRKVDPAREAPEDKFDSAQNAAIQLPRPWVGPAGDTAGSLNDHAYRQRTLRKVLPNKPYGGMVGAIVDTIKAHPDSAGIFWIGPHSESKAGRSGVLWFTVNDVVWRDNRFYEDNIGSFLVRVTVIAN